MMNKMLLYEPIFIDTWGWLAFGHKLDAHHVEVKQVFQEIRHNGNIVYTSDYVLNELITLLFRRENFNESVSFMNGILASVELHQVRVERVTSERFMSGWELRKRFKDKPGISFTDFTSMVIMQEQNIQYVLTMDKHFSQVGMGFSTIP
jgi:predicted nucleic acid-binding protein